MACKEPKCLHSCTDSLTGLNQYPGQLACKEALRHCSKLALLSKVPMVHAHIRSQLRLVMQVGFG